MITLLIILDVLPSFNYFHFWQTKYYIVPSKNAVSANIKHIGPIEHAISGQSTPMVKCCMNILMFDVVDTAFSYGRALIVC